MGRGRLDHFCQTFLPTCGAVSLPTYRLPTYRRLPAGCPIARVAHHAFWQSLGQQPTLWHAAEDPSLAKREHSVDIELVTLRCAPFSTKNRAFPTGCEAALRELRAVMKNVHVRSPRLIVLENTSGQCDSPLHLLPRPHTGQCHCTIRCMAQSLSAPSSRTHSCEGAVHTSGKQSDSLRIHTLGYRCVECLSSMLAFGREPKARADDTAARERHVCA